MDVQYPAEGGTDEESLKEGSDTRVRSLDEERGKRLNFGRDVSDFNQFFPLNPLLFFGN